MHYGSAPETRQKSHSQQHIDTTDQFLRNTTNWLASLVVVRDKHKNTRFTAGPSRTWLSHLRQLIPVLPYTINKVFHKPTLFTYNTMVWTLLNVIIIVIHLELATQLEQAALCFWITFRKTWKQRRLLARHVKSSNAPHVRGSQVTSHLKINISRQLRQVQRQGNLYRIHTTTDYRTAVGRNTYIHIKVRLITLTAELINWSNSSCRSRDVVGRANLFPRGADSAGTARTVTKR